MRTIHRFFSSLKTALFLLFVLCAASILGTLIPQGLETIEYLQMFPRAGFWILAMGAQDLYHHPLFTLILGLLSLSTLVCTLTRLKVTRRRLFHRLSLVSLGELLSSPARRSPEGVTPTPDSISNWPCRVLDDKTRLYQLCSLIGSTFMFPSLSSAKPASPLPSSSVTSIVPDGSLSPVDKRKPADSPCHPRHWYPRTVQEH